MRTTRTLEKIKVVKLSNPWPYLIYPSRDMIHGQITMNHVGPSLDFEYFEKPYEYYEPMIYRKNYKPPIIVLEEQREQTFPILYSN